MSTTSVFPTQYVVRPQIIVEVLVRMPCQAWQRARLLGWDG